MPCTHEGISLPHIVPGNSPPSFLLWGACYSAVLNQLKNDASVSWAVCGKEHPLAQAVTNLEENKETGGEPVW